LLAGAPPERATAGVVLLHGRGADPEDMMGLAAAFWRPDVCYLAPRAAGGTWYPYSFLAPLSANEPWLSSALHRVRDAIDELAAAGLPATRVMLLGFSQGACLALEAAARNARRYGALVGFSGGLIGPPGAPRQYQGDLAGTPTFLGCSDVDPHIPWERVEESATVLRALGATVTLRRYAGMAHTVNEEEVMAARSLLDALATPGEPGRVT
jgi:predicted esterase